MSSYPGAMCQPERQAHGEASIWYGQLRNESETDTFTFTCPIVWNSGGGVDGGTTKTLVQMHLLDRHPTRNVTCTYSWVFMDTAFPTGYFDTDATSGFAYEPQAIWLGRNIPNSFIYEMTQSVACSVPTKDAHNGASGITGYHAEYGW